MQGTVFQTVLFLFLLVPRLRPGLLSLRSVLSSRQITMQPNNKTTKQPDNKTTRQQDNKITKQPDNKTTKQLNIHNMNNESAVRIWPPPYRGIRGGLLPPYSPSCSFIYSRGDIPYIFLNMVEKLVAELNPQRYIISVMLCPL